jgi:ribosomal-protein-alanine N-acetyltransferase
MIIDKDKIIRKKPSIDDIKKYFNFNKSKYFRYFDRRKFDIINSHIYTSLYYFENDTVGYGHIESEDGKNWLGMFITDKYRRKGIGNIILEDLLNNSFKETHLTVDKENIGAINLYKKFGFNIENEENNYYLMSYSK